VQAIQVTGPAGHHIPVFGLASFQLMFAVITVALLAGAVAERTRFWPWLLFVALWVTVVYLPLAHWVFDPSGWLASKLHLLDFAGGTARACSAGCSPSSAVMASPPPSARRPARWPASSASPPRTVSLSRSAAPRPARPPWPCVLALLVKALLVKALTAVRHP
jgi:Ammonium Transporter Family